MNSMKQIKAQEEVRAQREAEERRERLERETAADMLVLHALLEAEQKAKEIEDAAEEYRARLGSRVQSAKDEMLAQVRRETRAAMAKDAEAEHARAELEIEKDRAAAAETRERLRRRYEAKRPGYVDRVLIGLDYFDASINRVAAWVIGTRNMQKALLNALLQPSATLKAMQDAGDFTRMLMQQEEMKTYPFGAVWEEYCRRQGVPADESWFAQILRYEQEVLSKRS